MGGEKYTACVLYGYANYNPKIGEWLHFEPYDDVELMEYTGYKDKNGKEIYEGDVIQTDAYWVGDRSLMKSETLIIKDIRKCYKLRPCTVIGNIYENPGFLLK